MSLTIESFPPLASPNSRILILGSIPGKESLRKQEYYGHPRNAFWRICFELLKESFSEDYTARCNLLKRHGIALWDVIAACNRKSSLDTDIKNDIPNDFSRFFIEHPQIDAVFFNGAKATDTFRRQIGFSENYRYVRLPSTSPAHAIPFAEKKEAWKIILDSLD